MSKTLKANWKYCDLPNGMGQMRISSSAMKHILSHRQDRFWKKEAGGQLFASIDDGLVSIEIATGPHRRDKRTRYGFMPDRAAERLEIEAMHKKGLHYVGDWHSHPEAQPRPSCCDWTSISETVAQSSHQLSGFFMVIVGSSDAPEKLFLCLVAPRRHYQLQWRPIPLEAG